MRMFPFLSSVSDCHLTLGFLIPTDTWQHRAFRIGISYCIPIILPTRATLLRILAYGKFKVPIIRPTCGSRIEITV
jgi:hypothetical protein